MKSHIKLKIKIKCIIGLLKKERKNKQKIKIKLTCKSQEFLDYAKVDKLVKKTYKNRKFKTIEKSQQEVSKILKSSFPDIYYIKIKTSKKDILKNSIPSCIFKEKFNKL